jgi:hypothetical protein
MQALGRHLGPGLFPFVLANTGRSVLGSEVARWQPVALHYPSHADYQVIEADVLDAAIPWRHDSGKLASQILHFFRDRQTPLGAESPAIAGTEREDGLEAIPADIL